MAYKRKRTYAPKRRTRRKFRRGSKSKSKTGSVGRYIGSVGLQYKARRISGRTFRKKLWDSTLLDPHYRSVFTRTQTISTPATNNTANVVLIGALDSGVGAFWEVAGGLQQVNVGIVPPAFAGDLVLRGGKVGIRLTNGDVTAASVGILHVSLYLLDGTNTNIDSSTFPATPVSAAWDPTLLADFRNRFGVIVMQRKCVLSLNDSKTFEYRLPVKKIDRDKWALDQSQYRWIIVVSNSSDAIATDLQYQPYFNVSFAVT